MEYLNNFNRQHREVLALLDSIKPILKHDLLQKDPTEVKSAISNLTGKLSMQLAMEDKSLYPRLVEGGNTKTKLIAQRFIG